jgi:hypothetical protein
MTMLKVFQTKRQRLLNPDEPAHDVALSVTFIASIHDAIFSQQQSFGNLGRGAVCRRKSPVNVNSSAIIKNQSAAIANASFMPGAPFPLLELWLISSGPLDWLKDAPRPLQRLFTGPSH